MPRHSAKPPKSLQIGEINDCLSAVNDSKESSARDYFDDFDLLDSFDPDSDASCWDPGEIDLEEPDFDPRDFYLEDDDD